MIDPSAPPARLFTTFGTVLYVDSVSGELRHGPIETSPANALFVADTRSGSPHRAGWIVCRARDSEEPVLCSAERCQVDPDTEDGDRPGHVTPLEVIPLERGLFGLRKDGLFLTAEPDGRLFLSRPVCSTWECFLGSEEGCAATGRTGEPPIQTEATLPLNQSMIKKHIIDPRLRAKANAGSTATKILIYGYPQWSHGRVNYEISKRLAQRGFIVDLLNWQVNHTDYIEDLKNFYDFFLTAPDGVATLSDSYGVPYDRMIVVSHQELDIRALIERKGPEVFDEFAAYGVVSEFVYCASLMQGVRRPPMVVSLGVDFSEFYSEVPDRLEIVGYASSMSNTTFGVEWKRGHLAEAAAREAGLPFKVAGSTGTQISFHDMPDFYRTVDAVLTSSISEAAQLPVMEAAAAGRLVIGTPVGHFPLKAYQGGGIIAPIEAAKFTAFAAATLRYYKEHPAAFVDKCRSIQEAAKQFDWKYSIGEWVELIESARAHGA